MRRVWLGGFVLAAACGPMGRAPGEVTIDGRPPSIASADVQAGPPLEAGLPKDAAAVLAFDLELVPRALASAIGTPGPDDEELPAKERAAEEALGVAKGALRQDRVLDTLGLDPSRPGAIALASIDERARPVLVALDREAQRVARAGAAGKAGAFDAVKAALGKDAPFFEVRARIPVRDGGALAKRAIRHALSTAHMREAAAPAGMELVMGRKGIAVGVSADASWLVVDVVWRPGEGEGPDPVALRRLTELRTAPASAHAEPPELGDATAKGRLVPLAFAEAGFLNGVAMTMQALANVEPQQRDAIAATGLGEAHRAMELAGDERGAFFKRVDVRAEGRGATARPTIVATAAFGPAYEAIARSASGAGRGVGVDAPGAYSQLDASLTIGLAFPHPGDGPRELADEHAFSRRIREAGWAGPFVVAPLTAIVLMSIPVRPPPEAFDPPAAARKLERVGFVEWSKHDGETFVGLVRAGASEAEASCVLAGQTPCAAHALRPNGPPAKIKERWVRLVKVGDRFAVLIGRESRHVEAPRLALSAPGVAAIRARLPPDVLGEPFGKVGLAPANAPQAYDATVELAASELRLRIEPR